MKLSRFLVCVTAAAALAACNSKQQGAADNAPVKLTPVAPPAGGDWTQMVTATADGGMLMGNPDAKVKLVEYGSMTCPHCRAFDETGVEPLINTYVKSGQVSWEFRSYLRNAVDLAATLIAQCNGPKSFFPITRAIYKDQTTIMTKLEAVPPQQMANLQTLPTAQIPPAAAQLAGLQQWAAARGVPEVKSAQCLSNETEINRLVGLTSDVPNKYPNFTGTPNFAINGKLDEKIAGWPDLESKLREALN
jgi:protein-disulfide isomerase